jgi:hypothetical protein
MRYSRKTVKPGSFAEPTHRNDDLNVFNIRSASPFRNQKLPQSQMGRSDESHNNRLRSTGSWKGLGRDGWVLERGRRVWFKKV